MNALKIVVLALIVILIVFPLVLLFLSSFYTSGQFSVSSYTDTFSRRSNIRSALNTVYLSILTTIFATLVGSVLAWIVARTDVPGRSILKTLLMVPYMIPLS